jgi:hypothetical protein
VSASAYLDAIAAAYPTSQGPAGNQSVQTGKVYSYDDVKALIAQARSLALEKLMAGGGPFDTAYVSHVITALKAARDAVVRAGMQASGAYHGSELGDMFTSVAKAVGDEYDAAIGVYERAAANATLLRTPVVALPTYPGIGNVFNPDRSSAFEGEDFRDSVTKFLDGLTEAIATYQGYEAYAKLMGGSGLLGFIGEAVSLVVDALRGVWGLARGLVALAGSLGSALGALGSLAPLVVYGGLGLAGYWGAKRVGLIGAKSA